MGAWERSRWLILWLLRVSIGSSLRAPLLCQELGCSPTLSLLLDRQRFESGRRNQPWYYFDPLRLANDDNFARFRECELKHGRVAMLAMLQVVSIPLLQRVDLVDVDVSESLVMTVQTVSSEDILRVLITCAVLELVVLVQRDPNDMPGDYGTGFLGLRDKGAHENDLVIELENGRLAMIGIVGFVISDYLTSGQPWIEQWASMVEQWNAPIFSPL